MLKIDRYFANELGRDPKGTAIIGAVCALGQNLETQILAEGIETADQLERLRALGCELGQGYYSGTGGLAVELLPKDARAVGSIVSSGM